MSDGFDVRHENQAGWTSTSAWTPSTPSDSIGGNPLHTLPGGRMSLHHVIDWLPRLGAVLWMARSPARNATSRRLVRHRGDLLIDHPALNGVARCTEVSAHTAVHACGPREWLCFRDERDRVEAKLFLLPDTDYYVWDSMLACHRETPEPCPGSHWKPHAAFFHAAIQRLGSAWQAQVLLFRLRKVSLFSVLEADEPAELSPLSEELVHSIAAAEHADHFPYR